MSIKIDYSKITGKIKPMHAVNNGPVGKTSHQTRSNFDSFKEAHIPYVRTHDASFFAPYGGEHTVDVHAIFPDFTKNPYDPASYDFVLTDEYLQTIIDAGSQVFYRLGSKIEHWKKKYGTIVPADFKKWAVICEHIIRHYNEGWANGYHFNILYWELWNEPDGKKEDGDQPNWSGTPMEFYEFYETAAVHLKSRFPDLKIGGPAVSWFGPGATWTEDFMKYMSERNVPIDFFSWHVYAREVPWVVENGDYARKILDKYGYKETESILNEYNYLINWTDRYVDTIKYVINERGAAFTASVMCAAQKSSIDMLMYYDARPCVLNGLFDFYSLEKLKGYYPFKMFSELYVLENEVESISEDEDVYVAAAARDGQNAAMIAYFSKEEAATEKHIRVELKSCRKESCVYLLDKLHDCEQIEIEIVDGVFEIDLLPDSVLMIK